jgi:hypothetical protein
METMEWRYSSPKAPITSMVRSSVPVGTKFEKTWRR